MRYFEVLEAASAAASLASKRRRARERLIGADGKRTDAAQNYHDALEKAQRARGEAQAALRSLAVPEAHQRGPSFNEQPLLEKPQAYALRDRSGSIIGWIEPVGQLLQAKDRSGSVVGWYDGRQNKTRDKSGRLVGTGDFLSALVLASLHRKVR